ncbi:hypothetical protein CWE08_03335 [Aliidiomarina iranensis]|uniref:GGDEF domain-containing protein n=1 Tax=Aliidiomarina iranensis TaxID=1434071 RepID=A0A432VZP4_9GAMM|nr:GGDEF domain-containing phosphodiesterase [Aliidiomarina iranensis]RUO22234.1 hypothetical protein CWE08_03335 [Aliidiomarina iranensis]
MKNKSNADTQVKTNESASVKTTGKKNNVGKRLGANQENTSEHQWLLNFFDCLFDAIVIINQAGTIVAFNRTAQSMFGYYPRDVIGRNVSILMPPSMAQQHQNFMHNAMYGAGPRVLGRQRELEAQRKDGSLFPVTIGINEADWLGEPCYIGSIRDISERREAEQTIESLSMFDALTGLPNRANFIKLVQHQLHYSNVRVVAINMDYFNRINIAQGEDEGDEVLRVIAGRLSYLVSEYNGVLAKDIEDRFWIGIQVSEEEGKGYHQKRMSRLLSVLREEIIINGRRYKLTASIGLATMEKGGSASEIVAHAETAVHQAKTNGRDQFSVYKGIMTTQVVADFKLEQKLRAAVQGNEIECWVQSKVNGDGQVIAAEALARWRHKGNLVSPDEFIPLAERLGIINDIGDIMSRAVARAIRAVRQYQPAFKIAMNVSPRQFMNEYFVANLCAIFVEEEVDLAGLQIEITENLLIHDIERVKVIMDELAAQGVSFSVDDFGTGYSNLQRLQWIPVTELKIDRQFVQGGMEGGRPQVLLETIISMSQNLGMSTVVEGIETEQQFKYLRAKGIEEFQGFFFHRPEPVAEWLQTLN